MSHSLSMTIDHNGQELDTEVHWDEADRHSIHGLGFNVVSIGDRDPTAEEVERLDEELSKRYETDNAFMQRVSEAISDWEWGSD